MSTHITEHFTREECEHSDYAIAHGIPNQIPDKLMPNCIRLCNFMEELRSYLCGQYGMDVPIIPSSVFRGTQLNAAVKGKSTSQHMRAEAMDWHPGAGLDIDKTFDMIENSDLPFDQLINEYDREGHHWIHTSIPDEGKAPRREVLTGEKGGSMQRISIG